MKKPIAQEIGKKHPCTDCSFCQLCNDEKCAMCRPAKPERSKKQHKKHKPLFCAFNITNFPESTT